VKPDERIVLQCGSSELTLTITYSTSYPWCRLHYTSEGRTYDLGSEAKASVLGRLIEQLSAEKLSTLKSVGRSDGFLGSFIHFSHGRPHGGIGMALEHDNRGAYGNEWNESYPDDQRLLFITEETAGLSARMYLDPPTRRKWLDVLLRHFSDADASDYEAQRRTTRPHICPVPSRTGVRDISSELIEASGHGSDGGGSSMAETLSSVLEALKSQGTEDVFVQECFRWGEHWSTIHLEHVLVIYVYGRFPAVFHPAALTKSLASLKTGKVLFVPFEQECSQEFVCKDHRAVQAFSVYHGPEGRLEEPFSIEELVQFTN